MKPQRRVKGGVPAPTQPKYSLLRGGAASCLGVSGVGGLHYHSSIQPGSARHFSKMEFL